MSFRVSCIPKVHGRTQVRESSNVIDHSITPGLTGLKRSVVLSDADAPLYVIELRGDKREVIVGGDDDLRSRTLTAHRLNWIAFENLDAAVRVKAKIRHRHEAAAGEVRMEGEYALVSFDEPQRAITPGQAVVFYDGDLVVGGGWIC